MDFEQWNALEKRLQRIESRQSLILKILIALAVSLIVILFFGAGFYRFALILGGVVSILLFGVDRLKRVLK